MGGGVPASAGRAGRLRQSICGPRLPAGRRSAETQEGPGVTSGNLRESPGAGRRSEPAWDGAETEVGVFSPSWPSPGTRVTTDVRCFGYKSSLSIAGPKIVSIQLGNALLLPSLISLQPFLSRLRSGGLRPSLPSLPLPLAASLSHSSVYSSFCLPHSPQHFSSHSPLSARHLPLLSLPLFPGRAACKQEVVKREKKKKGCGLENLRSSG